MDAGDKPSYAVTAEATRRNGPAKTAKSAGLVALFVRFSGVERSFLSNSAVPAPMARVGGGARGSRDSASREMAALRRRLRAAERRLEEQEKRLKALSKASTASRRRQAILFDALQLGDTARRGDRGVVRDLQESVVRLEDYLLKTADRIETILTALKQHRELLASVNKRVLDAGTKDRIRLELDVMKNTLSILVLHGVEFDPALVKEIDGLRAKVRGSEDLLQLERAKSDLDKKFDGELKKFDLEAIWSKKEIPGYR